MQLQDSTSARLGPPTDLQLPNMGSAPAWGDRGTRLAPSERASWGKSIDTETGLKLGRTLVLRETNVMSAHSARLLCLDYGGTPSGPGTTSRGHDPKCEVLSVEGCDLGLGTGSRSAGGGRTNFGKVLTVACE